MTAAQAAFASRDTELSRAVHQSTELAEIASGKSEFLHGDPPSFSTCPLSAAVAGSVAVSLCVVSSQVLVSAVVLVVCVVFLIKWISDLFKSDFHEFERNRERWEVENFPQGEIQEMLHIYTSFGVSDSDAQLVAETLSKYPEFWVEHMMLHEIGIVPIKPLKISAMTAFLTAFVTPILMTAISQQTAPGLTTALIQTASLLFAKSKQSQWMSTTSTLSIFIVLILTCASMHYAQVQLARIL